MTRVTQIADVPSGFFSVAYPTIYHIERLSTEARSILDAIWSRSYGEETIGVWRLENVWVAGVGLFFDQDGEVLRQFLMQADDLVARARDEIAAVRASGKIETVEEQCMVLVRPGYINYGHWLTEMLPQLLLAQTNVPSLDPVVYIAAGVSAPMQALQRASINEFARPVRDVRIYDFVPRLYREVIVVYGHAIHGPFHSPRIYEALRTNIQAASAPRRRLYVRRSTLFSRIIVNEPDVAAVLDRHGFETIAPEEMTLQDQISTFSESAATFGVAGAGLTNACWQAPGTACLVAYPSTMLDTFFWWISQHNRLRFFDLRCEVRARAEWYAPWDGDIYVDPDELDWLLRKQL